MEEKKVAEELNEMVLDAGFLVPKTNAFGYTFRSFIFLPLSFFFSVIRMGHINFKLTLCLLIFRIGFNMIEKIKKI